MLVKAPVRLDPFAGRDGDLAGDEITHFCHQAGIVDRQGAQGEKVARFPDEIGPSHAVDVAAMEEKGGAAKILGRKIVPGQDEEGRQSLLHSDRVPPPIVAERVAGQPEFEAPDNPEPKARIAVVGRGRIAPRQSEGGEAFEVLDRGPEAAVAIGVRDVGPSSVIAQRGEPFAGGERHRTFSARVPARRRDRDDRADTGLAHRSGPAGSDGSPFVRRDRRRRKGWR